MSEARIILFAGLLICVVVIALTGFKALAGEIRVAEGQQAPDFELLDQHGRTVRLSEYAEKGWVVLYFYPKDDTPGCTKEACSFRDNLLQLQSMDATVLGISVDGVQSHAKFAEKFDLNFPILSDTEYKVCELYGTLTRFMGMKLARRSTFLIDPDGIIQKVFPRVKPVDHAIEVAQALKALQESRR